MLDVANLAIRVERTEADEAARSLDTLAVSGARVEKATDGVAAGSTRMVAGLAAATAAGGYLVSKLADATRAAGALESSLASTGSMLSLTRSQMGALEAASRELSAGTIFSAAQIAAAFSDIAADAGKLADSPEQLQGLTRSVIELATATRSQLPEAGEALLQVMRQFEGVSADSVVDVVASLGSTASELQETVQALGAAGPVARALGVSFTETAAAINLLADAGIEGSEAGAGLALVLRQLDQETDQSLRPSVVGLEQALRNAAAAQFEFEGRSLAVGTELARNADAIARVSAELQNSDAGARLAADATNTYAGQVAQLDASLATLTTTIGTALLPTVTDAVSGLNQLLTVSGRISELPPLFDDDDAEGVDRYVESLRNVDGSMADAAASVAKLGVGLQVVGEILNIKLGDDIGARMDEIFAAADRRTELLNRLADQADGTLETRGPTSRRYTPEPKAPQVTAPQSLPQAPEVKTPKASTRDTAVNALAAPRFLAQAAEDATDDPVEKLRVRFDLELQEYAIQGTKLAKLGAITTDQRAAAIATRWQANEASLQQLQEAQTLREADTLRQRDARLMQLRAEGAASEFESDRLRLEASLLLRQEATIKDAGSVDEGMKLIADIRERGYADIAKREEAAAERDRQLALRTRQEKLATVAGTMVGLATLVGAGTDRITGIQRAAALASVLINIPETASDAYKFGTKAGGPVLGAAWAALSVAAQVGYASQLGGGGGGAASGAGVPPASSVRYAASGDGQTYTESVAGDAPSLAVLKDSDRFLTDPPASGALTIDEPDWSLPALTVNTPQVTIPEAPTLAAPTSRPEPASLRVEQPALEVNAPRLSLAAPELPTLAAPRPAPLRLPDDVAPARSTPRLGAPVVNIINQSNQPLTATSTASTGPDGQQMIDVVLRAVAQDIVQNGQVSQMIATRFGLQQQLGFRS